MSIEIHFEPLFPRRGLTFCVQTQPAKEVWVKILELTTLIRDRPIGAVCVLSLQDTLRTGRRK
jgi:hypothetical protein